MAIEQAFETTMTAALYAALGQTVTYTGSIDGVVSIKVMIRDVGELIADDFETLAADADASARVNLVDVPSPRENDTIATIDGTSYTVDSYQRHPESTKEWLMVLRRG